MRARVTASGYEGLGAGVEGVESALLFRGAAFDGDVPGALLVLGCGGGGGAAATFFLAHPAAIIVRVAMVIRATSRVFFIGFLQRTFITCFSARFHTVATGLGI